jgi:hypothetical protein
MNKLKLVVTSLKVLASEHLLECDPVQQTARQGSPVDISQPLVHSVSVPARTMCWTCGMLQASTSAQFTLHEVARVGLGTTLFTHQQATSREISSFDCSPILSPHSQIEWPSYKPARCISETDLCFATLQTGSGNTFQTSEQLMAVEYR